jgi:hypothetical protein
MFQIELLTILIFILEINKFILSSIILYILTSHTGFIIFILKINNNKLLFLIF